CEKGAVRDASSWQFATPTHRRRAAGGQGPGLERARRAGRMRTGTRGKIVEPRDIAARTSIRQGTCLYFWTRQSRKECDRESPLDPPLLAARGEPRRCSKQCRAAARAARWSLDRAERARRAATDPLPGVQLRRRRLWDEPHPQRRLREEQLH